MPTARPNLASWERRLLASALDAALMLLVLTVVFGFGDAMHLSIGFTAALSPVVYLAYHSAALLVPRAGLGRTVAGISVVSVRGDGSISRTQAVVRPAVRLGAIFVALLFGMGTSQPWLIAVPLAVELALIAHTPWRQSLADLLAGTIVINTPRPQPHRAPAGPMFSANDAEFGPQPRKPQEPNPSIERTSSSKLRLPPGAAHVER